MILIVGASLDDVEYIQKRIIDPRIEVIANRYYVYSGMVKK